MHDILPNKQARARGIIRSHPRPHQAVVRPANAYQQVYSRVRRPVKAAPTIEEVTVTTVTTTISSPMIKAIEHLSSDEKAEALRRARLQVEGVATFQRAPIILSMLPSFDTISTTVTRTVTKIATTTKRTLPKIKKLPVMNQPIIQKYGLYGLAAVMILITGYVSIDTLITNSRVREQAQVSSNDTGVAGASDTNALTPTDASQEGQDETDISALISQYSVAPDKPRVVSIPSISVKARVIPMGVNPDKSVQSPVNIFDSGWYNGSSKPGEDGAMFIDAHASGPTRMGLFAYLDTLEKDDEVMVEKGDGTTLTYKVVHKEILLLENLDMNKALNPYGDTQKALNLMTCIGEWIEDKQTYDHRVIIYTEQVS